jgi:hypothetical protein
MPLWGIALAYGPNINDFEMDRERAKTADEYVTKEKEYVRSRMASFDEARQS